MHDERPVCSILVVDDVPDDAFLAARAVRTVLPGCHVRVAGGGREALALLRTTPGAAPPFSLVLLDLRMPEVDGFEVLRRIRGDASLQAMPVVVFTGSDDDEACVRSYGLRANSYIRKPSDHASFVAAVTTIGEYWLRLNSGSCAPSRGADQG